MRPGLPRLVNLALPSAGSLAVAVGLGAATVASGIGLMATSAYLLSAAALQPSIADLSLAIVGVRAFGLARGILRYAERLVSHSASLKWVASLRAWLYRTVEPQAPARTIHARAGDLLARAVSDLETLQDFFVRVLAPPAVAAVTLAGMGWFLGVRHVGLAVVGCGFMLATGVVLPWTTQRLSRRAGQALVARRASLHAGIVEFIRGMPDLMAHGEEGARLDRLAGLGRAVAADHERLVRVQAVQAAVSNLLASVAACAVLVTAVSLGSVPGTELAALALATLAAFEAILPLSGAAQSLETILPAAQRLMDLADLAPAVRSPPAGVRPGSVPARVGFEIRNLSFAYGPTEPMALEGVSFELREGARSAIVGPSGAGKSTLLNLLVRFWEFDQGQILVNGIDIRRLPDEWVRRHFSVVSHRTHLFHASLAENLLVANPAARPEDIQTVLRKTRLETLVRSLPHGLETSLGEFGLALSAGERQRIGIARALLRAAPVLVVDEPTANLDPLTEQDILATLHEAAQGRTSLWITHRLLRMESMDEVLVFNQGRIVERGQHSVLVGAGGLYQRLWELQHRDLRAIETALAGTQSASL